MISAERALALTPDERKQMAVRERLKGLGEVDIVRRWYECDDPWELTPTEDFIRKRWDYAKAQFLDRKTYQQTVDALMAEFSISIAQARNDIKNMRLTFGPIDDVPKIAKRQLAMQMALEAFDTAKKNDDADGMAKATTAYIKAAGLDKDDTEPFDMDRLMKERNYVEIMDPQIRSLLLNLLEKSGGALDTTALFQQVRGVKDQEGYTDYEEVQEETSPEPE